MKERISRRVFVQSGALIAAAAVSSAIRPHAQPLPPGAHTLPVQLGLASYTFRNFTRAQMIGFLKQLNVAALNGKDVKDHLPADPAEEAKALEDYAAAGVTLHAAGVISFLKDDDADIRAKFEYCRHAGVSVLVAGGLAPALLPCIERFVKEYDMRFAIHNHGPEDKTWPSPLDVLKQVKSMDPRLGCCIDLGHAARAGTDVVQAIYEAGPRLFNLHMKDLTSFQNKESQVAVGEGIMPVHEIFAALVANKYKGFVDLEYEIHADDPMPGVIASFAYMRGVLAGMGYATHA